MARGRNLETRALWVGLPIALPVDDRLNGTSNDGHEFGAIGVEVVDAGGDNANGCPSRSIFEAKALNATIEVRVVRGI